MFTASAAGETVRDFAAAPVHAGSRIPAPADTARSKGDDDAWHGSTTEEDEHAGPVGQGRFPATAG